MRMVKKELPNRAKKAGSGMSFTAALQPHLPHLLQAWKKHLHCSCRIARHAAANNPTTRRLYCSKTFWQPTTLSPWTLPHHTPHPRATSKPTMGMPELLHSRRTKGRPSASIVFTILCSFLGSKQTVQIVSRHYMQPRSLDYRAVFALPTPASWCPCLRIGGTRPPQPGQWQFVGLVHSGRFEHYNAHTACRQPPCYLRLPRLQHHLPPPIPPLPFTSLLLYTLLAWCHFAHLWHTPLHQTGQGHCLLHRPLLDLDSPPATLPNTSPSHFHYRDTCRRLLCHC